MADKNVEISTEKRVALVAILFAFGMLSSYLIGESAIEGLIGLYALGSIIALMVYLTK